MGARSNTSTTYTDSHTFSNIQWNRSYAPLDVSIAHKSVITLSNFTREPTFCLTTHCDRMYPCKISCTRGAPFHVARESISSRSRFTRTVLFFSSSYCVNLDTTSARALSNASTATTSSPISPPAAPDIANSARPSDPQSVLLAFSVAFWTLRELCHGHRTVRVCIPHSVNRVKCFATFEELTPSGTCLMFENQSFFLVV